MCRKVVFIACLFVCCGMLFALPQFGSSAKKMPIEDTVLVQTEPAVSAPETISASSQNEPSEEPSKKGFLPFRHKEEPTLAIINDMYAETLKERDAELDKVEQEKKGFKPVLGLGLYTNPYADEPTYGAEGFIGVQHGTWTVLVGAGYADVTKLDDPLKEGITGHLIVTKAL